MNDERIHKKAANACTTATTIFSEARKHTLRVMECIRERYGPGFGPAEDQWRIQCKACDSIGHIELNLAETVIYSKPSLTPIWLECRECRVREWMRLCGVPGTLLGSTVGNWEVRCEKDGTAADMAYKFASQPVGFLVLSSETFGNGKSHLAVGILRRFFDRWKSARTVRFITQAEILRCIRRRYDDSRAEDVVQTLALVPFLVIDDVGVSSGGKDEKPALYEIISDRYADRRPTVMTTNHTPEEFRDMVGERMSSRLRESTYAWVTIHGSSYRAEKRNAYLGR